MRISEEYSLQRHGFAKVDELTSAPHLSKVRCDLYRLINGEVDVGKHRSDLAPSFKRRNARFENVTQIMWPSDYLAGLKESELYATALDLSRMWLGEDMAFDFDMVFFKAPGSSAPTPFHQDIAYWPALTDKRALSCWIALDDASIDNGCLWFIPSSHIPAPRPHYVWDHRSSTLACAASEDDAIPVPLRQGSCTFHLGETIHYSRGNTTGDGRGALILNFRPASMIAAERRLGFDHGRTINIRENRNAATRD